MTGVSEAVISSRHTQARTETANRVDESVDQGKGKSGCEYCCCFENDYLKERSAADHI